MKKLIFILLSILIAGSPLWPKNAYAHRDSKFLRDHSPALQIGCKLVLSLGIIGYILYRIRQSDKKYEAMPDRKFYLPCPSTEQFRSIGRENFHVRAVSLKPINFGFRNRPPTYNRYSDDA